MSRSGGATSRSAANRAAGPRATATVPVRRKSRRETIATGRVVVGFVMSVLSPGEPLSEADARCRSGLPAWRSIRLASLGVVSGSGSRRHVRRVQALLLPGGDPVAHGLRFGRLLLGV